MRSWHNTIKMAVRPAPTAAAREILLDACSSFPLIGLITNAIRVKIEQIPEPPAEFLMRSSGFTGQID